MRIIAGEWRGRTLRTPKGRDIRPTPDRVREALFSILGPDALDGHVLDLFAGTGALGLEALSRGAPTATFVERARASLEILRANIRTLGAEDRTTVQARSALTATLDLPEPRSVSLVLADPPYAMLENPEDRARIAAMLSRLVSTQLLADGALVVVEHRHSASCPEVERLPAIDRREYGETGLAIHEFRVE